MLASSFSIILPCAKQIVGLWNVRFKRQEIRFVRSFACHAHDNFFDPGSRLGEVRERDTPKRKRSLIVSDTASGFPSDTNAPPSLPGFSSSKPAFLQCAQCLAKNGSTDVQLLREFPLRRQSVPHLEFALLEDLAHAICDLLECALASQRLEYRTRARKTR
jgi:hypothetical protein